MQTRILRRQFKGLGTSIDLRIWPDVGRAQSAALRLARAGRFLRQAERRLSRFDPESELSRLNRGTPTPRRVSRMTFAVIRAALTAARATDGLFDPTILPALLAAGYDRSFDQLHDREPQIGERDSPLGTTRCETNGLWQQIRLNRAERTVWLPPGVGLDLGGIAKGWLADRVLRGLHTAAAACVDLGGDIAFSAPPAKIADWQVGADDPRTEGAIAAILRVRSGGVATSGITRRTWTAAGERRHHLIDPRSGRPAATDLLSVTVAAPSTAAAEVAAKTALILGREAGLCALEANDNLTGVLIPAECDPILVGASAGR